MPRIAAATARGVIRLCRDGAEVLPGAFGHGQRRGEQVVLATEVVVDQGDVDVGPGRHRAHRGPLEAEVGEQRARCPPGCPRGCLLVAEINDAGGKAHFVELDVVDQDQWDAAVVRVKEQAGALHVLMNIVGSNALVRFPEVDIDEFNKIFEINVTGTLRGIQTCAPLIRDSGGGSIVNIGSVAGITGNFSTEVVPELVELDGGGPPAPSGPVGTVMGAKPSPRGQEDQPHEDRIGRVGRGQR